MSAITTTTLAAGDPAELWSGAGGSGDIQVINLDTEATVYLGSTQASVASSSSSVPLGPLASQVFDGAKPLYAQAATQMQLGLVPGGSNYSPGSLTITGPVTAEITGPVTAEIDGTVQVAGTVEIGGTPTVDIAGTPTVNIAGTPTVDLAAGATVDIAGTTTVSVANASINVAATNVINVTLLQTTPVAHPGGATVAVTQSMPVNAEGYQVTIVPTGQNANQYYVCDLEVTHLDQSGNQISIDAFTLSDYPAALFSGAFEVTARGAVLGASIAVSVTVAAASFINTVMGMSTTAPAVTANIYALPFLPPGGAVVLNPVNTKMIFPASDFPVTTTSQTLGVCFPVSGPVYVNLENKGTSTQIFQAVIQSYTVSNGPTGPQTTWFSPYVSGQNATTQQTSLTNMFSVIQAILRSGSGTANCDVGITAP